MEIPPTDDVVALVTRDHEAVKQCLIALDGASPGSRSELFWKLMEQLVRHEVAEQEVMYPVLRKEPGGEAITKARLAEEATAERILANIEGLDATTEEFMGAIRDLRGAVLEHAQKEEAEAIPLLLANEDSGTLQYLGQKYKSAKLAAPSHPHPHAPSTSPGNKIVGPVVAFIDRMRDSARAHSEVI
jgi:hypothetical protein